MTTMDRTRINAQKLELRRISKRMHLISSCGTGPATVNTRHGFLRPLVSVPWPLTLSTMDNVAKSLGTLETKFPKVETKFPPQPSGARRPCASS